MRRVIKVNKDKNVYMFVFKLRVIKTSKHQHNNNVCKILIVDMQTNDRAESSDYKRKANNT